jgi:UDP-N-acetylmuramate--alanine ligase
VPRYLCEAIMEHGHRGVEYVGSAGNALQRLGEIARDGDVVFTMGAGSVYQVGEELLSAGKESR